MVNVLLGITGGFQSCGTLKDTESAMKRALNTHMSALRMRACEAVPGRSTLASTTHLVRHRMRDPIGVIHHPVDDGVVARAATRGLVRERDEHAALAVHQRSELFHRPTLDVIE